MTSRMVNFALRAVSGLAAPGGRDGRFAILIYHRVLPRADEINGWYVTVEEFERQMAALRAHYSPLPLSEAIERLQQRSLPSRAVCVTFDDGYADNAEVALPILQRHDVAATFFIASGYLNGGRMWNDSVTEAIRRWPHATLDVGSGPVAVATASEKRAAIAATLQQWKYLPPPAREARVAALLHEVNVAQDASLMMRDDQVRQLRAAGMEIGAHTVSHPILANLTDVDAKREIVDSGRYLSEILREPIWLFAYPNGKPGTDYGPRDIDAVRAAGYRAAFSTAWGVAGPRTDIFQLPRFTPWDRDPRRFSLRLALNFRNAAPETVAPP